MKIPTHVAFVKTMLEGKMVSILCDEQTGHDLALALSRFDQTTLHMPDTIRDLRLRLDAALVGDPRSRRYVKENRNDSNG